MKAELRGQHVEDIHDDHRRLWDGREEESTNLKRYRISIVDLASEVQKEFGVVDDEVIHGQETQRTRVCTLRTATSCGCAAEPPLDR
jgi:hypothetical protein